ncbi:MAG: hypothetical protein SCARUB_03422 [Candidatus Scalindua rubra]|uniref:Uncharacterized protein n=1 Tax=Candidatus Scalindua rubra TaxID=1872076 RepID=A0A1E3X774_9BACT|nr:MAG: hypothetical protein SCARUB_03422 [Candidatus Scalindua rubra]
MHWITILGIILIATGTIVVYFGRNFRNRFDDEHFYQSIGGKPSQIDELMKGNNELLVRIEQYQKSLSEKNEIIQQLEAQVNELNVPAPHKLTDEQIEAVPQVIPETDFSDVIAQAKQAKSLCNKGRYDEAYKIADDLRQKNPDFGLAYFLLGTIEMRKEHYDEGEKLLNRAIQRELPDEDKAWAFHNLGISSVRREDFEKAKEFLGKAVELKPDMEKSKKALKYLALHFANTQYVIRKPRL